MLKACAVFSALLLFSGVALAASEIKLSTRIVNSIPLNADLKDCDLLAIRVKAAKPGVAELFWAPSRNSFSFRRNYPVYVNDQAKPNLVNLAAYTRDGMTTVNHLLLIAEGPAEITEIKFIRGGLWQKMAAGWQEFFGPLSRTQDGMEYIIIRSPRLFGRPFLSLVNALLFVLLLVVLLLRKKKDLRRAFLAALLVCWGLVELNSLRNNWLAVRRDARYLGQPLEVKRAMINEGDFYAFLKFAERELPVPSSFDVLTYGLDHNFRAAYYLYPRSYGAGGRYLLVYDRPFDKLALKQYKLWKLFRPGAAIYKS